MPQRNEKEADTKWAGELDYSTVSAFVIRNPWRDLETDPLRKLLRFLPANEKGYNSTRFHQTSLQLINREEREREREPEKACDFTRKLWNLRGGFGEERRSAAAISAL